MEAATARSSCRCAGCNRHLTRHCAQTLNPENLTTSKPLRRVPEECPDDVEAMIARCLDNDPAARPSARELVQFMVALPAQLSRGDARAASTDSVPSAGGGSSVGGGPALGGERGSASFGSGPRCSGGADAAAAAAAAQAPGEGFVDALW